MADFAASRTMRCYSVSESSEGDEAQSEPGRHWFTDRKLCPSPGPDPTLPVGQMTSRLSRDGPVPGVMKVT
eukprot:686782-Hanusia_phi.AAC.2